MDNKKIDGDGISHHICLDLTRIHCPIFVAPGLDVVFPPSHGMHVVELLAPITVLYVETRHKVHVETDVAPKLALYVPAGQFIHVFSLNEEYFPAPQGCVVSSPAP